MFTFPPTKQPKRNQTKQKKESFGEQNKVKSTVKGLYDIKNI